MVGRGPPSMLGSLQAGVSSSSQKTTAPCGACKLLRRRCTQDCPFSPYFSPHEPHKFASVHKVFGASNASKMLMEVPEARRMDTANSLIFEASIRLRDPVYGCMGAISALQRQIYSVHAELVSIKAEIVKFKLIEQSNNLVAPMGSDHTSNNFISPYPSLLVDVVANSFAPLPPHPTPPILSAATSVVRHLVDPTMIASNGDAGYSFDTNVENADSNYISSYFH